jgi:peptide chain release factor subunit 1
MGELRIVDGDEDLRGLVRELAHEGDGDGGEPLLSMYVNVDAKERALAFARADSVTALLAEAERQAPDGAWAPVLRDLRDAFEARDELLDGASGLLVFARAGGDATVVKLPCPVEPELSFDSSVHLRQLVSATPSERWCVLLCNRRTARLLLGDRDRLVEVEGLRDDVDGQHAQGGYSQSRWARAIEGQVEDHVRHAVDAVQRRCRDHDFDSLLIACPAELRGSFEHALDPQCAGRLRGWLEVDVDRASTSDVSRAAAPHIAHRERSQVQATLDRLQLGAGRGERVVLGLDDVCAALCEQRVETLDVASDLRRPGFACEHGDWFDAESSSCPVHGQMMQPCADVVELAIEAAVRQRAHVTTIARHDPAAPPASDGAPRALDEFLAVQALGSIAATVRFDLREQSGSEDSLPG